MFCTSPDYVGVCALVRLLCLSLIFFFFWFCFCFFFLFWMLWVHILVWLLCGIAWLVCVLKCLILPTSYLMKNLYGVHALLIFFFFWDLQKTMFTTLKMVALWNCLIGMCFEMFDLAHQLFDEKPIWGSRLIDIFFLGPIEDHVYHP